MLKEIFYASDGDESPNSVTSSYSNIYPLVAKGVELLDVQQAPLKKLHVTETKN